MTTLGIGSRIKHPSYGVGVVIQSLASIYRITFVQYGTVEINRDVDLEVIEAAEPPTDLISLQDVEKTVEQVLRRWGGTQEVIKIGSKWTDGTMVLKPANADLKPKEIPIETFFHKIVMVRDRLRVMEQRINSSKLSDTEKVSLQQYITRIYGSLTTFNVLFRHPDESFKGVKK